MQPWTQPSKYQTVMKHFALLIVLALGFYFAWRYAPRTGKKRIKKGFMTHFPSV